VTVSVTRAVMAKKLRRVVVVSDLHCGHIVGLTHPDFDGDRRDAELHKLYAARREYWNFYIREMAALRPVDILVVNGDAIDGKGERSGGTELITADRNEQVDMAVAAIEATGKPDIYMVAGTPYHVGVSEDWERQIVQRVKALKFGIHDWINVNGLTLDYRHFVSGSQIPYGRHTAVARERLWNVMWAEDAYPHSDVIIRSHVHYFSYAGGVNWLGVTTPALQGLGTKYGAGRISGTVNFGFIHFDIAGRDDWSWSRHILKLKPQAALVA